MARRLDFVRMRRGEQLVHEQDLPAALAADLDGSFERLVVTFQDRLYIFALRLTGSPPDAEEIVVDAFARAYQALAEYPAERLQTLALRPWLYQITRNVFRNRVRGRRLQLVPLEHTHEHVAQADSDGAVSQPDMVLERTEFRTMLAARIAALPERERTAVVLRHVQGLGYGEMATLLRQPVGTVKANVHRGIRRLRKALTTDDSGR
jgi:RNA polymerase sigma-70 factor (ECF subfamily)